MACLPLTSGRRAEVLAPPAGDGQPPVPAEVLLADLRSRRVLPALVLGRVDQPDDPLDQRRVMTGRDQLGAAHVLLHVVVEQCVEHLVRRQRVGVELPGSELGAGRGAGCPRRSAPAWRHRASSQTMFLTPSLIGATPPAESPYRVE